MRDKKEKTVRRRETAIKRTLRLPKPQTPIGKNKAELKRKSAAAFEMYPPPMLGSGAPDENGRYRARVLSVGPAGKGSGGEPQFVVGIETPDKRIHYLIDKRSAVLLAFGLRDHLRLFHSP